MYGHFRPQQEVTSKCPGPFLRTVIYPQEFLVLSTKRVAAAGTEALHNAEKMSDKRETTARAHVRTRTSGRYT